MKLAWLLTFILQIFVLMAMIYPTKFTFVLLLVLSSCIIFAYHGTMSKRHEEEINNMKSYIQLLEKIAAKELRNGRDKKDNRRNQG